MRTRTAAVALVAVGLLGAALVAGVGVELPGADDSAGDASGETGPADNDAGAAGGDLVELWISDTARENEVNHHPVGVGPSGRVVVAPVAAVPNAEAITNRSCSLVRLEPGNGSVRWRASVAPEDCFTHALTQPSVADLDGDGDREVAAATTEDALVVYDAATGDEQRRVPLPTYGYGRPAVAPLRNGSANGSTGGSGLSVVVSDIGGNVAVVRGDGTVAWRRALNATVWATPVVRDVDADGGREVVVGSAGGVTALDADGGVLWESPAEATTVAAGQADDDPAVEVFATWTGTVVALDGATGEVEWRASLDANPRVHAVGDADGDGDPELYASLTTQAVAAIDAGTGEVEWRGNVSGGDRDQMPPPVLADVDGDGGREVVAVANDGTVAVLDPADGSTLAGYERAVRAWTFPTPADLDGDGASEILVRYGDGRVVALDFEG